MDISQKIISLSKRRSFVFPSSEIYGGFAAIYDYGHYGVLLKTIFVMLGGAQWFNYAMM